MLIKHLEVLLVCQGGGAYLGMAVAWVTRELYTLVWSLLSAQIRVVSVATLPVVGCGPFQCGRLPKVAFSLPQVSLPGHASLMSASVRGYWYISMSLYVFVVVGGDDF